MRLLLSALVLACALAWSLSGRGRPAPLAAHSRDAGEHEAGRRVYNFRCYFCHGYSGDARTLAASMVQPAPRDFTRAPGLPHLVGAASGRPWSDG